MPRYSSERSVNLFTTEELAELLGISARAVRKAVQRTGAYFEWHVITTPGKTGGRRTKFIDVTTTGYQIDLSLLQSAIRQEMVPPSIDAGTMRRNSHHPSGAERNHLVTATPVGALVDISPHTSRNDVDVAEITERLTLLADVVRLPGGSRHAAILKVADQESVSPRTVYRWIRSLEQEGVRGVARQGRCDAGSFRIPHETYRLIVAALITNPPTTPAASVHRTLVRAAPTALEYRRGGKATHVSVTTIRRVRSQLLEDPHYRLLFFNEDQRKEYLRTYAGEVVSAHANDLWQMDMTRCDTMVIDPETGRTFRPRVHAIIDVYSGCIPGIVFSVREDQPQTDLAILRSVLPKSGPYADKYPVFGVPRRLYLDNGKTYTSEQAHRVLSGLGVDVVHSLPRVSHTRGRIERFFGTLHSFERALPGYVGRDASDRATSEIKRLTRNSKAWLEHGRDPGHADRLLTIDEYQNFVLAWLVAEYHAWPVDGKTRLEHFSRTAPPKSQAVLDKLELLLLFAERTTRVVEPGGTIRLNSQRWSVPDGSLIRYQGKKVLALRDQFTLGDGYRLLVWKDRHGRLEVIGQAVPAPTVAESLEAGDLRRASTAQAQQALRDARRQARELTDPELRVSAQLAKEAEVVFEETPVPSARGRLAAVRPPDPREGLDSSDPLVQHLMDPLSGLDDAPEDPVARLQWIRERRKRGDA